MAKSQSNKYVKYGAIVLGALGAIQLSRLISFAKQLTIVQTVNFSRGDIRVTPTLKNPTSTKLTVRQPFIRLFYKNQLIAASQTQNNAFQVPAAGEVKTNEIVLPLNWVDLAMKAPDFFADYTSGKGIKIQLHKHSAVRILGLFWQDVHTIEDITIAGK